MSRDLSIPCHRDGVRAYSMGSTDEHGDPTMSPGQAQLVLTQYVSPSPSPSQQVSPAT